jgi:hypothetical protein
MEVLVTDKSTEWVVVANGVNPAEAEIIRGRLESNDIPAMVQREESSIFGMTVGEMGGANVLVPASQADQALEILSETFDADELE